MLKETAAVTQYPNPPGYPAQPEPKRRMSGGTKIGLGCGCAIVLVIVALCAGVIGIAWYFFGKVEKFAQEFEAQGYRRVETQSSVISDPVAESTVFVGQNVTLNQGADADIAFAGQMLQIKGTVRGDLAFIGQMLELMPGAVVEGDIDARFAQAVIVRDGASVTGGINAGLVQVITIEPGGFVGGMITGEYQVLDRPANATLPDTTPPATQPEEGG